MHRCRLPFCDVTVGLVRGRTGILLVDTGTTLGEATAIAADVKQIAGCQVTHVVLTHKHFDHVLGSSVFDQAEVFCAPEVVEYLRSATDRLREDALSYGADTAEVDRAIAALKPPQHGIYDAAVDLGDRTVTITHPGSGHTTADLVVVAPATGHADGPTVVFTGDLVEESADPELSTPIPTWRPGRQRLIGYLRSAALTPATSRGTGRSSMRSLSVASAPGCEHVRAASLVKRQLLCRASGDERIRVGNADPQFAHRHRLLPHLCLFGRIDRQCHQALT
ncbi:hypothetical protein MRGA327_11795 [Mycobacterium tuberculosis RGTB327]|nr:hypothetical protein MRGA327_11795 [Mycobacterium tuberculosis RGTB327]